MPRPREALPRQRLRAIPPRAPKTFPDDGTRVSAEAFRRLAWDRLGDGPRFLGFAPRNHGIFRHREPRNRGPSPSTLENRETEVRPLPPCLPAQRTEKPRSVPFHPPPASSSTTRRACAAGTAPGPTTPTASRSSRAATPSAERRHRAKPPEPRRPPLPASQERPARLRRAGHPGPRRRGHGPRRELAYPDRLAPRRPLDRRPGDPTTRPREALRCHVLVRSERVSPTRESPRSAAKPTEEIMRCALEDAGRTRLLG